MPDCKLLAELMDVPKAIGAKFRNKVKRCTASFIGASIRKGK